MTILFTYPSTAVLREFQGVVQYYYNGFNISGLILSVLCNLFGWRSMISMAFGASSGFEKFCGSPIWVSTSDVELPDSQLIVK